MNMLVEKIENAMFNAGRVQKAAAERRGADRPRYAGREISRARYYPGTMRKIAGFLRSCTLRPLRRREIFLPVAVPGADRIEVIRDWEGRGLRSEEMRRILNEIIKSREGLYAYDLFSSLSKEGKNCQAG